MAELFKFRCPRCEKLLGVPPRKIGRAVHCPRCRAELVVPGPGDGPGDFEDDEEDEAEGIDLGIDLGFASPLDIRPEPPAAPPPDADARQAIAFLETAADRPDPPPDADDATGDPDDGVEPVVAAPVEPIAPRPARGAGRVAPPDRRRDVVLPRTAAIAWALFALLALALSFTAGLMIGHYRWK